MRIKILVYCVLFFVPMNVYLSDYRSSSIDEALLENYAPRLNWDQKFWLIKLPALIMEVNGSSHITLKADPYANDGHKIARRILKYWWGIEDKYDLISAIRRLDQHGNNEIYQKLARIAVLNPKETMDTIGLKFGLTKREMGCYQFLAYRAPKILPDILAWDIGREAALIRWGHQAGFLNERLAWRMLLYLGRKAQHIYGSWVTYGNTYAYGRLFWASGLGKFDAYDDDTIKVLRKLLSARNVWNESRWDLDLSDPALYRLFF